MDAIDANIREEFHHIVAEHELAQRMLHLEVGQVDAYLREFLPIELWLKELWVNGEKVAFWDEYGYLSEIHRFRNDPNSVNIQYCRHFRYDYYAPHTHEFFQIDYVYAGHPEISINDFKMTADPGDFILLAPHTRHCQQAYDDNTIIIKAYVKYSTFEKAFFKWLGIDNILSEFFRYALYGDGKDNYIVFKTGDNTVMREFMLETYREYINRSTYYEIISECRLTELFCRLVRDFIGTAYTGRDTVRGGNVGMILKYISDNRQTATLDSTALWAGYSKNYLCRLLMKTTGKTFTQILNSAKIDIATNMLKNTDMSINEVSARAGFNTIEHFYRVFREYKDMTPQNFREEPEK